MVSYDGIKPPAPLYIPNKDKPLFTDPSLFAIGDDENAERGVWVFKRGTIEEKLPLPQHWSENVKSFCVFGSWIVGVCETAMLVWKTDSLELYTTLQGISPVPFTTCVATGRSNRLQAK